MKMIGAFEAKVHFSELLRDVENGETIVITRHGLPVAQIAPLGKSADSAEVAMQEIHRLRREVRPTLDGITIRELIEDGRRY